MEASSRFKRFEVLSVKILAHLKILKMKHFSTGEMYVCNLGGSWYHSYVSAGDIVHVQSEKYLHNTYFVDDRHGLITIEPDKLIWSTWLSNSVSCMRKTWLSRMFTATATEQIMDEPSLIGEIVHDIFQTACTEKSYSLPLLKDIKERCLKEESLLKVCSANRIDMEQLTEKVDRFLLSIFSWFEEHFHQNSRRNYKLNSVIDIEESMNSPSLGIEGSLDVTYEVEIHGRPSRKALIPLELKTGRANTNFSHGHRIQVMSYSMGMKERGPNRNAGGLLLYLRNKRGEFKPEMSLIEMERWDEVELLQRRNELARFMSPQNTNLDGPHFVNSKWLCDNCDGKS
ncbi:DNA replication ATP-dependent helicase/nuclease DNA2-like [Brevipalpus obovatus]|uniref:DNA replication ATP-dependent helicase/nuclease DNA2-like n=1 Tax=Brevipalpus obovatus TaxID=246614 RepID=UPI003D9FA6B3